MKFDKSESRIMGNNRCKLDVEAISLLNERDKIRRMTTHLDLGTRKKEISRNE